MNIESTIRQLELRGFGVSHFATGAEAAEYLKNAVAGCTVGIGGSSTIDGIGIYDMLPAETTYWHWKVPGAETLAKADTADVYLSSVNAISEDGQLLSIDGNGNRVSNQLFGHKKLYIVASVSKICPDFDSALYRARNTASVQNCKRFPARNTPCKIDDKCHDCRGADRLCRGLVVLWGPMMTMPTEVILIDETLGF